MTSATQFAQKKLLDHTLGLAAYTMPTAWLGLFKASPGETGSLANEVSGGSYARVSITALMAATVLGTGIATNSAAIGFASPTAAWGTLTHWGVCDASTAGNALLYGQLASNMVVASGSLGPSFVPGTLSITAPSTSSPFATQYLAKKLLDHLLGKAAFTMPTAVYLALFSSDPGATGSLAGEIAVGGYGRQIVTPVMDATVLTTGIASSNDVIQFPTPTANYSVTHLGVADALTSGNVLLRKARGSTLSVVSGGSRVRIDAGKLALQVA